MDIATLTKVAVGSPTVNPYLLKGSVQPCWEREVTEKQEMVLEFIRTYIKVKGFAPSMQDIASGFNMRSRSNIHRIIHALQRDGYITLKARQSRTMRVIELKQ